jgi:hypothetical protein
MSYPFHVRIYAGKRGLLKRKQWFARTVNDRNRLEGFRSSEGYNNRGDLVEQVNIHFPGVAIVYDDPHSAVPTDPEDQ